MKKYLLTFLFSLGVFAQGPVFSKIEYDLLYSSPIYGLSGLSAAGPVYYNGTIITNETSLSFVRGGTGSTLTFPSGALVFSDGVSQYTHRDLRLHFDNTNYRLLVGHNDSGVADLDVYNGSSTYPFFARGNARAEGLLIGTESDGNVVINAYSTNGSSFAKDFSLAKAGGNVAIGGKSSGAYKFEVTGSMYGSTTLTLSGLTASKPVFTDGSKGLTSSGVVGAPNGGTDQSSYTIGDILYASGTTALSKLSGVATGNALISGGVGAAPSYGKIGLTTHVSGVLPPANGGASTGTMINSGTSAAFQVGTYYDTTGTNLTPKSILGGAYVTITTNSTGFTIAGSAPPTGTMVSSGSGAIFQIPVGSDSTGTNFVMRDILAGSNISVTTNSSGFTIAATGLQTAFSTGYGITNVANVLSNNIVAGSGVSITAGSNGQLTIASTVSGGTSGTMVHSGSSAAFKIPVSADGTGTNWTSKDILGSSTLTVTTNSSGFTLDTTGLQPLDSDLTAVAGLSANGLIARTGAGTMAARTITTGSTKLTVANGDGVSANPVIDVDDTALVMSNLSGTFTQSQMPNGVPFVKSASINFGTTNVVTIFTTAPGKKFICTGFVLRTTASTTGASHVAHFQVITTDTTDANTIVNSQDTGEFGTSADVYQTFALRASSAGNAPVVPGSTAIRINCSIASTDPLTCSAEIMGYYQ